MLILTHPVPNPVPTGLGERVFRVSTYPQSLNQSPLDSGCLRQFLSGEFSLVLLQTLGVPSSCGAGAAMAAPVASMAAPVASGTSSEQC